MHTSVCVDKSHLTALLNKQQQPRRQPIGMEKKKRRQRRHLSNTFLYFIWTNFRTTKTSVSTTGLIQDSVWQLFCECVWWVQQPKQKQRRPKQKRRKNLQFLKLDNKMRLTQEVLEEMKEEKVVVRKPMTRTMDQEEEEDDVSPGHCPVSKDEVRREKGQHWKPKLKAKKRKSNNKKAAPSEPTHARKLDAIW